MQPLEVVVHVFDETDVMGISRTEVKTDETMGRFVKPMTKEKRLLARRG